MKIKYIPNKDKRNQEFEKLIHKKYTSFLNEKEPELILTSGGDGTILKTLKYVKILGYAKIPVLCRASGTLNFLCSKFQENDEQIIQKILNNEINIHKQGIYPIDLQINDQKYEAISDVLFGHNVMDWHKFSLTSEDKMFNEFTFSGMGINFSTPVGSTGFNMNNGGRILNFCSASSCNNMWSITSLASNAYINDIMEAQKFEVKLLSDRTTCKVYIDGKVEVIDIDKYSEIIVSPSFKQRYIAYLDEKEFFHKRFDYAHKNRKIF